MDNPATYIENIARDTIGRVANRDPLTIADTTTLGELAAAGVATLLRHLERQFRLPEHSLSTLGANSNFGELVNQIAEMRQA